MIPSYTKHIIIIVLALFCFQKGYAQETIKGQVIDAKSETPLFGVAVKDIKNQNGISTGIDGKFIIKNVHLNDTLIISYLGYETKKIVVKKKSFTIKLPPSSTLLNQITITAAKEGYSTNGSEYVAKMPIKKLENPQSYIVIPKTLIEDQMALSYDECFKNIPGTEIPSFAYNGRMDISSRGFKVRSQIVDGVSGYTMTNVDPANIENIEVIRGPSATLFGSSLTSYGGLVNIVTKKPYNSFGGSVSYHGGSFGFNRLSADINTPINKKRNLLFRINTAAQSTGSYQDAGFNKSIFVAPTLTYKLNDNITLNAEVDYYKRRATSPFWFTPYKKTQNFDARDIGLNQKHSFTNDDIYYDAEQINMRVKAKAIINENWTSNTIFSRTESSLKGLMLSLIGNSDSTLVRNLNSGPRTYNTIEVQQNFLNDQHFGKFRNRVLLGLDFYQYNDDRSLVSANLSEVNFIHPDEGYDNFTRKKADSALATSTYNKSTSSQNTYSAYFSDVISFNKRWFAMLSLRLDQFENRGTYNVQAEKTDGKYSQIALSPKLGLVYQAIPKKVSLYVNYMNGFSNVNGTDFAGNIFEPQQADQWEGGVKLVLFKGKLNGTISAYNIQVSNMLRNDLSHINYSVQDGTQLSRGVEISATSSPIAGLNIIAGYAYNQSEYVKAKDGMQGRRPDGAGPENTANIWVCYEFKTGKLKGIGIGAGGRYGSNVSTIKHFKEPFNVPGFKVFDAGIFYEHKFYRVALKFNNITNETYRDNRLRWQAPFGMKAGVTVNF